MSADFRRKSAAFVLACALLVCAFAAWSGAASKQEPSPYDDEEYREIIAQRVADIYGLEAWASAVQDDFMPILPPAPELILRQPGYPEVLPFTAKSFPPEFLNGLAGVYENSVPVYPVLVVEDPKTRALTFHNLDGEALYMLPPPAGYDPFAFLRDRWPGLFTGAANDAARRNVMQLYDPARIQVRAKLIEADHLALWIYAKRRIEEALALQSGKGEVEMKMMLGGAPNSNIFFTVVKRATNFVSMTIQHPSGFTNGLDVFTCNDLMAEVWAFGAKGLATTGTNVTWLDTNAWVVAGFPTRLYAAADAATDGDGDGYADGREIMVYGTDPMSAASHPVTVSGIVSYSGIETGGVYVLFTQDADSWAIAKSIWQASPAAYTNAEVGNGQSWWFKAFRDANGNFEMDAWEARGAYSGSSTLVTGNLTGVNIAMADVPSIWGQISYGGTNAGDVHVVATTGSNGWDATHSTTIPYIQGEDASGGLYYVTFPVNYMITGLPASNYWIRAYMDTDTNGVPTALDPAGQYSTNSIPVSNRVSGVNVAMAYDSDGDGLPDWWEMTHWGNLAQGSGGDSDGDGVTNSAEYALNADPNLADTDGDGVSDLLESQLRTAANIANAIVDVAPSEVCVTGKQQAVTLSKFTLLPQYCEPGQAPTNPVYFLNEFVRTHANDQPVTNAYWQELFLSETVGVSIVNGTYDFAHLDSLYYSIPSPPCSNLYEWQDGVGARYGWDFAAGTGFSITNYGEIAGWGGCLPSTYTNWGTTNTVGSWSSEERRSLGAWTNHTEGMSNIVLTLTTNTSSVLMQSSNQGSGWTYSRTVPHTTAQLVTDTTGCLAKCTALADIPWSNLVVRYVPPSGGYMPHGGSVSTQGISDVRAYRDLAGDETSLSLERLQYRIEKATTTSGAVYRATVLHMFTPEGAGTSAVAYVTNLWAKGTGDSVVFLPTNGVTIEPPGQDGVISLSLAILEFKELWETSNRVNQVFNSTPKDDPPPTASNKIYVVESPDSLYHVTLDVDDQPASMRSKLMYAIFVDGSKISGSDGFYPATGPANITFDHPSLSASLEKDFELRVGYDLNGNSTLDSTEERPISVTDAAGTVIGPPIARGTSSPRYPIAMGVVDTAVADTLTLPHASSLLRIFRDATTTGLPADKAPTATGTISFNCYSDPWAVWLTHNAGALFNASGTASIQQYVWGTNTSLADLVCKSHQMVTAAETLYNSTVLTAASAFFATNPVGTIATFPLNGTSYDVPHTDESPSWVTNYLAGVTVTLDEPNQWNIGFDDVFGAIGRGRVLSHMATYTIEKIDGLFGPKLVLNSIHYTGVVEDIYDFNRDGGGAGEEAAIIQLGHGNGSYGTGRTSGVIYKERIEINQPVSDPF